MATAVKFIKQELGCNMNHPQKLVELYRRFYRAPHLYKKTSYGLSARKAIQPLFEALDVICRVDSNSRDPDTLVQIICGKVASLMKRIRGGAALGFWVIPDIIGEHQAIQEFAEYVVVEVFYKAFGGDVGRLAGRQRGYLEDACDFLYRLEEDKLKQTGYSSSPQPDQTSLDYHYP